MEAVKPISFNGQKVTLPDEAIEGLKSNFRGQIIQPSDESYESSRMIWNGMIDRRPRLIARCSGTADVIAAVKFARQHNLLLSIRSGGHHVAGKSICDGGMVLDLSSMRHVHVDPKARTARVQGGATLGDIDHETQIFGLAAALGAVSATGVAGLTLHGGYGWLSRKHGLSLDNLLSVEVVTADGSLIKADAKNNPDLFWAVRGGGGNFGVVTSFEFQLHPIGSKVWFMLTLYPVSMAKKALTFFRDYMQKAPDELTAIALFWNAPKEEFIPEKARGKPVFILAGVYSGKLEDGEKALAPLRQIGEPIVDLSQPMVFKDVQRFLDADYPDGRQYYWKSSYLDNLNDDIIDKLIEHAAKRPSPLTSLDVWALGGKISRTNGDSTSFFQRKANFLIGIESNWENPDETKANIDWTRRVFDDCQKQEDAGVYLNFPGFGEEGDTMLAKSYGKNYRRLKKIKAKYDPDNFFQGFISINNNNKS